MLQEFKKYNLNSFILIFAAASIIPFVVSGFVVLTQKRAIQSLSMSLISENFIGPWTSLLFGLLTILLVQMVMEVEKNSNLLSLYKVYKNTWYLWILRKAGLVLLLLLTILVLNAGMTGILFSYILSVKEEAKLFSETIISYNRSMLKGLLFMLPTILLQILLTLMSRKVSMASLLGIILLIVGIPIANLSELFLIPYNYSIFSQKPSTDLHLLFLVSLLVSLACLLLSNFILKKGK